MKRPFRGLLILFVASAVGHGDAGATTWVVDRDTRTGGLAETIATAAAGDTIRVIGGSFEENVVVDRSLTLIGENWPVIDGRGTGTIMEVTAPDVTIRGFVIRNSGTSLEAEHAGVSVDADRVGVIGNRIENVLFGVYMREADSCLVADNRISGYAQLGPARQGDLVRAWYSSAVRIENNVLEKGRDLIVWFSDHSSVRGNRVSDARYGVHLMYDRDCEVSNNTFIRNSVGAYLMYSRRILLTGNAMAYNRGPSGFGVGLKDLDDSRVVKNCIVDNRVGVFIDNSPREIDSSMLFEGNIIAYNDQGILLPASVERTRVIDNSFMDNYEHVAVPGGGRVPEVAWLGNYWSDYAGYDGDGDGRGDVPYRSDKLFEDLIGHHPRLRVFVYSPAMQALSLAATAFPVVRPQPKLVDDAPRLNPYFPPDPPVVEAESARSLGFTAFLMLGVGIVLGLGAQVRTVAMRNRGDTQ
jgi:nitrous oxidase accessory protein